LIIGSNQLTFIITFVLTCNRGVWGKAVKLVTLRHYSSTASNTSMIKNILRIFKYIKFPKKKLALYLLLTLLATVFSVISLSMLSPFMNIIFKMNSPVNGGGTGSFAIIAPVTDYLQQLANEHKEIYALGITCIFIIISIVLKNVFLYLSYYVSVPVRSSITSSFRIRLYQKILDLPVSFFTDQKKGDLMSRMVGDIGEVDSSIVTTLEGLIKDPLTILAYLTFMIFISPYLSLVLLVLLPVTALLIGRISKSLKKQSKDFSVSAGQNLSHVDETLGGVKIIKGFSAEEQMMEKFKRGNDELFEIRNNLYFRRDLASPLTEILGVAVLCVILYVGGRLVLSGINNLNAGDLVTYIATFAMIINPAKALSTSVFNIQRGMGAIERIEEILHAPVVITEKPGAQPLSSFSDKIEFRNVSFGYNDAVILDNVNLVIEKGKTIALVGSSGAGKSTLADLVPRFHDVIAGELLVDGINIKDCTIQSLRSQMSIVTQEPILFNDTIASNIRLAKPSATDDEIISAATVANAHNFIIEKEQGYNTNIGDRGSKLSGGERQRLTIARAVLKNPPILILDEATSSLDTESERLVQDAINKMMQNRTSIVIAHRLSTIRHADEIIVLQKGKIVERGTHEQLLAQNGFYRKLVDMQEVK
jgi:subfamily B ATP-binding cassette protein MsbA